MWHQELPEEGGEGTGNFLKSWRIDRLAYMAWQETWRPGVDAEAYRLLKLLGAWAMNYTEVITP
jgi:hypothetical protein